MKKTFQPNLGLAAGVNKFYLHGRRGNRHFETPPHGIQTLSPFKFLQHRVIS